MLNTITTVAAIIAFILGFIFMVVTFRLIDFKNCRKLNNWQIMEITAGAIVGATVFSILWMTLIELWRFTLVITLFILCFFSFKGDYIFNRTNIQYRLEKLIKKGE